MMGAELELLLFVGQLVGPDLRGFFLAFRVAL